MPQRFTNPVIKYTTDTLKTLPGALLYFYENGTSTPKVVFQDIELTIPHAHPVVADSAGNFAPIFLAGTYRAELKNAAGVTQPGWPVDNVGGEEAQGQLDDWSSITNYQIGRLVTGSDGQRYESQATPNLNRDPALSANRPTYWIQIHLEQEYDAASTYEIGQRVVYSGLEYVATAQTYGNTPASTSAFWKLAAEFFAWNASTTYAIDTRVFVGDDAYISQQNANLNHNPVGDSGAWWRPQWQEIPALIANYLSGGGALSAYRDNYLTDAGAYTLPLAASVPIYTKIVISMLDIHKAFQPTVTRSGSDLIRRAAGTDTVISMDQSIKTSFTMISNGVDEWWV